MEAGDGQSQNNLAILLHGLRAIEKDISELKSSIKDMGFVLIDVIEEYERRTQSDENESADAAGG